MSKTTFVVTDDAMFMRTLLRKMLEQNDEFEVLGEAANGFEAIEAAKKFKPDVMTLDITMPEMDGIAALREIRGRDVGARVLMVSAMGQQKMIVEALDAGALDFLVKPFQPTKVLETVKKCLQDSAG